MKNRFVYKSGSKIFNNLFQKTNLTPDEALKKLEKEYQKATEIFPKISDY